MFVQLLSFIVGLWTVTLCVVSHAEEEVWSSEQLDFFENKIRPVLVQECYQCHSADAKELGGKLLLDSRDGILKGGEAGAAVVAGQPNKSLLLQAMKYDDLQMPPDKQLPE